LYRKDYRTSNCDTVDGSNCKIVNGVNARASGINSLYAIRREINCRVIHPTRDNIKTGLRELGWGDMDWIWPKIATGGGLL
jgi:hypothetical protein